MEDLLIAREQWVVMDPNKTLTGMLKKEWEKLNRKERSMILFFLEDSILLNVSKEDTTKKLWDKLGNLY